MEPYVELDKNLSPDLIRLKNEGFVPDRDLILALTADEEGGDFNGVQWLLTSRPTASTGRFPTWKTCAPTERTSASA